MDDFTTSSFDFTPSIIQDDWPTVAKTYNSIEVNRNNYNNNNNNNNNNTGGLSIAAPWWVQITEIGKGSNMEEILKNIPKSRRGHSSTIFRVPSDRGIFQQDKELYVFF